MQTAVIVIAGIGVVGYFAWTSFKKSFTSSSFTYASKTTVDGKVLEDIRETRQVQQNVQSVAKNQSEQEWEKYVNTNLVGKMSTRERNNWNNMSSTERGKLYNMWRSQPAGGIQVSLKSK